MIFRRKRPDKITLRRETAKVIIDLKQLHKRAFYYRSRLENKIKTYEEKLLYIDDPSLRKSVIQNIAMYKNALKVVSNIEAVLELLVVRLETLGLLGVTAREIMLIREVLAKIKGTTDWIPEISLIAEDIIERTGDLLEYFPATSEFIAYTSTEADKILKEAEVIAQEKLRESSVIS